MINNQDKIKELEDKIELIREIIKRYFNNECPSYYETDCISSKKFCDAKGCYFCSIRDILEMNDADYCWCRCNVGKKEE